MSHSSLWVMDSESVGLELREFDNSWLFSPIIWDVLLEKYLPNRRMEFLDGAVAGYMSSIMFDGNLFSDLNNEINNCDCMPDRICWEMSQQQVFFVKDKEYISKAISEFLEINKKYQEGVLQKEHIAGRFKEVAESICDLEEEKDIYFIFKNTSCDDNVESWFSQYNKEEEEYESSPLAALDKYVTEFVVIKNKRIDCFIGNLDFFKEKNNS